MKKRLLMVVVTVLVTLLSGCMRSTYHQADNNIDHTKDDIASLQQAANEVAPAVVVKNGYYIDTKPVVIATGPKWLRQKITLQAHDTPFSILMDRLLRNSNISVSYATALQTKRPISINYHGTIKGALDRLAAQTNYFYSVNSEKIRWSSLQTKTFDVSFMPGSSTYLVGRSQGGSHGGSNGGLGNDITGKGIADDQQYSNLEGNLSVWNDLQRALNELKSKQGHVIVSESTTSVTVSDHPSNVSAMARYIGRLNRSLSQQVGIKVQVLEVDLSKDFNLGINWNTVISTLGVKFALKGALATAANPLTTAILTPLSQVQGASFEFKRGSSSALIKALNQQGEVRVVTRPQVVTMNDQIASIRITKDTGYIQSVSSSTFGGTSTSQNFITTTITPGTITDGFTLYILPKIQDKKVYMQISSTLSDLLSLQKESTGGDSSNAQFNSIQLPTISEKTFNQRSVVRSGATLIIAGYKRLRDEANDADLFGVKHLGGQGAQTKNIETLVLITPTVLH